MAETHTALLLGASRGLGLGLAREYLARGWHVVATARDPRRAEGLRALENGNGARLRIETLDVTDLGAARALAARLAGTKIDVLFVVAGQLGSGNAPIHAVSAEDAAREFVTNAWAPPSVAEALTPVVAPHASYVFMTSQLGSLANATGATELYSASKAALNMLGIGFSKRHPEHPVLLMHPGWVKTDMGGENAPLDVETSARGMIDTIDKFRGRNGVHYVDYRGQGLPW